MAIIPINLDDAVEAQPAAAGTYRVQITDCRLTETGPNSKHPGTPQFRVSLGLPDEPNTQNVTHFITLPTESDEPDTMNFKALLLKRFLNLFNIPYDSSGIDTEQLAMQMVGAEANAEIQLSTPDDNGNVYNRLIVPRIRDEGGKKKSRR